jgi:hypothetical protein
MFLANSDIHGIHTRQGLDLHYPTYKLAKLQKGVFYTGIRIFNNLPHNIKNLSNDINEFKYALKKFLQVGSFYSLGEYLNGKQGAIVFPINNDSPIISHIFNVLFNLFFM